MTRVDKREKEIGVMGVLSFFFSLNELDWSNRFDPNLVINLSGMN